MRSKGGIRSTYSTSVVEGGGEEKPCDCLGMEASKSPMGQATLQPLQLKKDGPLTRTGSDKDLTVDLREGFRRCSKSLGSWGCVI